MIDALRQTLQEKCLVPRGARLVVALSGGADSTALLLALAALREEMGIELVAAHFDHGWRKDSALDAESARASAEREGVPFQVERSSLGGTSEDQARQARYDFLRRMAVAAGADHVATGHTRNDQVETVVLRILRGTGLCGLEGMRWRRLLFREEARIVLVRPFLDTGRAEILEWLTSRGAAWVEDPTNAQPTHLRNQVRLRLLPLIEEVLPGAPEAFLRLARHAAELHEWLQPFLEQALGRTTFDSGGCEVAGEALRDLPPPALAQYLQEVAARLGIRHPEEVHVAGFRALLQSTGPPGCPFPGERVWRRSRGCFRLEAAPPRAAKPKRHGREVDPTDREAS